MQKISSQDRSLLIRFASSLPKGSPEKKTILAGLVKTSSGRARKWQTGEELPETPAAEGNILKILKLPASKVFSRDSEDRGGVIDDKRDYSWSAAHMLPGTEEDPWMMATATGLDGTLMLSLSQHGYDRVYGTRKNVG